MLGSLPERVIDVAAVLEQLAQHPAVLVVDPAVAHDVATEADSTPVRVAGASPIACSAPMAA
jgi:hypothetical protein